MITTALIVRNDAELTASTPLDGIELKQAALAVSQLIFTVNSEKTQTMAVEAQRGLRELLTAAEKQRKAIKEPILEFGRRIDAAAAGFVADLKAEDNRIGQLVNDYQCELAKRKREEDRKRQAELDRIERERQEAVREAERKAIAEATAARKAAEEAERKAREAAALIENKAKREAALKAAEEAKQRAAEVEKENLSKLEAERVRQAELAHQQREALAPPTEIAKAAGQVVREKYVGKVVNVWHLIKSRPEFVREILWDQIAINAYCAEHGAAILSGTEEAPKGLEVTREIKSSPRQTGRLIDV